MCVCVSISIYLSIWSNLTYMSSSPLASRWSTYLSIYRYRYIDMRACVCLWISRSRSIYLSIGFNPTFTSSTPPASRWSTYLSIYRYRYRYTDMRACVCLWISSLLSIYLSGLTRPALSLLLPRPGDQHIYPYIDI